MEQVRLFFSHSSKDDEFGRRLVGDLRAHLGDDAVWYDVSGGLHGGDEWWNRIVAEITARDTFLVLFSPDALTSDWVPREMGIAYWQHVKLGKRLVPLIYRTCEPPADWQLIQALPFTDDLPYEARLTSLLSELGYTGSIAPQTAQSSPVATNVTATPQTPKELLVTRLTQEIHTAFGRKDWEQVLLRARTLQDEAPEAMTEQLWHELGLAAVEIKKGNTALAALDHVLTTDPYDVLILRAKAQALIILNKYKEATQLLMRAKNYIPMDQKEPQLALLAELIALLSQWGKWREVVNACNEAIGLNPSNVNAWHSKGAALSALRQYKEALDAYNKVTSFEPKRASAWNEQGNVLTKLGRRTEAIYDYDRALAIEPKAVYIWINRGDALLALKRYEEALAAYDHALALDQKNVLSRITTMENKDKALKALGRPTYTEDRFGSRPLPRPRRLF